MNWAELNEILIKIQKGEKITLTLLCKEADINQTHVSKKVNNEPDKEVGSGILSKLKSTYPTYFGLPPGGRVTPERALLKVLLYEFAEYKALHEPVKADGTKITADEIVKDIENKAKIVIEIASSTT